MQELPFTGERFTPECVREIWYEHMHRYALARLIATGKRVLDVACGEGYGSAMVAPVARHVVGVDVSSEAVRHARARYGLWPNLEFREGDATNLAFGAEQFDLVLSFETLEHVEAQDALVSGLASALAPGGCALISSPDKATYSDATGLQNEFHVRELYRDELVELLSRHFRCVRLYGQRLAFHSTIWSLDAQSQSQSQSMVQTAHADGRIEAGLARAPIYYVAACAQREADLPAMPELALFDDVIESVYDDYRQETRRNMNARKVLADQQAAIAELTTQLEMANTRLRALEPHGNGRRFWPFGKK